jgi:hypothetical protein
LSKKENKPPHQCATPHNPHQCLRIKFKSVVKEALQNRFSKDEVKELFYGELNKQPSGDTGPGESCRNGGWCKNYQWCEKRKNYRHTPY